MACLKCQKNNYSRFSNVPFFECILHPRIEKLNQMTKFPTFQYRDKTIELKNV